ncbi:MAG: type II toxin-antitoxin system HicB family antitoxin [Candidatus Gottesmanbacteria bacterium]|nr:type II toxin-antitoxin system HicB family antitoxin [Candidatus Gottesmanbacteria bacterium]
MQTTVLNYRIIVTPDVRTGTNEPGYTALCPTLGVADDGDTIDQALANIKGAIECFVESLIEDGLPVPKDEPEHDVVTTAQVSVRGNIQYAQL